MIATFYGCLFAGCVPVTVRPPHPQNLATTLPTVKMIVEVTLVTCHSTKITTVNANVSVRLRGVMCSNAVCSRSVSQCVY